MLFGQIKYDMDKHCSEYKGTPKFLIFKHKTHNFIKLLFLLRSSLDPRCNSHNNRHPWYEVH